MLSSGFITSKSMDELCIASAKTFANQFRVTLHTFTQVKSINPRGNCVCLENGDTITYDNLVLALGAKILQASIKGNASDNVYPINNLMDYTRLREKIRGKSKILIMGAGLIGCEFANDLLNGGFHVEVVDLADVVLATLLPAESSRAVRNALETQGIIFHLETQVSSINKCDKGLIITLANGKKLKPILLFLLSVCAPILGWHRRRV